VDVEREAGTLPNTLDYSRSNTYVWDKVAVHHVDVKHICPRRLNPSHFIAETAEIGGEY
jgi:hypothetical protein